MAVASKGFFITVVLGAAIGATVGFYIKDKQDVEGKVRRPTTM